MRSYPGAEYHSVYEAGFCGFWIHERLTALGIDNIVVNPADVPTKSSEMLRKSDAVDNGKLARSLRTNELKGIYTPDSVSLEMRSLIRLKNSITKDNDSSEKPDQVPTSVSGHRDSAGVPRTVLQLVETLCCLVERGRDPHTERPSGPRHSYLASGIWRNYDVRNWR